LDRQTFMGKGVGQVARLCEKLDVPCIALAGVTNAKAKDARLFSSMFSLIDITSMEQAQRRPAYHLEKLSALAARYEFRRMIGSSCPCGFKSKLN
jgi:glycerate kinase